MTIRHFLTAILAFSISVVSLAQVKTDGKATDIDGVVRIDRTIWDFGDVTVGQGPLSCTFKVTNISDSPAVIYNVVSSCGCTDVKWTREPLRPGASGTIDATYSNDEGPYPFDKNLTVYISGVKKPVILRLRGTAHSRKMPLSELYPVRRGFLGLKSDDIKLGNLSQGSQRSDAVKVANLGQSPLNVQFSDVTEGMKISVSPNPVPAGQTATMSFIVTADRSKWGKNYYYATPVLNGRKYSPVGIWAFTKEDFSGWTDEQVADGPKPMLETSSFDFGKKHRGDKFTATFKVRNLGGSSLKIYKADPELPAVTPEAFQDTPSGKEGILRFKVDSSTLPAGEVSILVILTTNSPLRPIVNIHITGTLI